MSVDAATSTRSTPTASSLGRRVLVVAGCLVVAQLVLRGWVAFGGFFSLDDYVFYTRAGASDLVSASYLFTDYNGHLMPGSMIWVWLSTALAPLDFAPVAATALVLQLLVDVLLFLVLRRLFGVRPAILVPFTVFLFATLTLPGLVWWAAALNQLPQQVFMLLAVLAHLRYLRTGRTRDALLAPMAVLGGLAFSEKTLLMVPLLLVVTWFFFVADVDLAGLRANLRRYRTTWVAHGVLVVGYLACYLAFVEGPVRGGLSAGDVLTTTDIAIRRTVLPGAFGGPWTWEPLGVVDSLADPHPLAQVMVLVAAAAIVAYSLLLSRGAWRAWTLLGLSVLTEIGLLLATRVQVVGAEPVAAEYRYFTDLGIVVALTVGFAFLRNTAPSAHPVPDVLAAPPLRGPRGWRAASVHQPTLAVLALVAVVVGSAFSAATYRDRWAANPGDPYFAAALPGLRELPDAAVLYDGPVPDRVIWRLLWPATLPSRLVAPTTIDVDTLDEGESTADLVDIGYEGEVRPSEVSGIPVADGPTGCGWRVEASTVRIPLTSDAFNWNWVVELTYDTDADTVVELEAGSTTVDVPLAADDNRVFVAVTGELDQLAVTGTGTEVCITGATVGLPQPVEW